MSAALDQLPDELIDSISLYLDVESFLALTSCNRHLYAFRHEPAFWRLRIRSDLRLPPQPLLEGDGRRWLWLYRSLRTQTHVYHWGKDDIPLGSTAAPRGIRGWPHRLEHGTASVPAVDVVADVQCGGWSTVLLNSRGRLFAVGALDGESNHGSVKLGPLTFLPGYDDDDGRASGARTAIRQYSLGRSRLLAVSDNGTLWQWHHFGTQAHRVELLPRAGSDLDPLGPALDRHGGDRHVADRIVAGWSCVSAYVPGLGIAYWSDTPDPRSNRFVVRPAIVPGTDRRGAASGAVGEVTNYVVLEAHIVFLTRANRIFVWRIEDEVDPLHAPTELTTFCTGPEDVPVRDIQGSFRRFAVFRADGAVLLADTGSMPADNNPRRDRGDLPRPALPAALQNSSVVSLAFGDWHYHALHADGTVTSHGHEPVRSGALGLGPWPTSKLRGVQQERLVVPEWGDGRRTVWFEDEKLLWLTKMFVKAQAGEAAERGRALLHDRPEAYTRVIGEWFERAGRNWSAGPAGSFGANDDDGGGGGRLPSHFALKVSAAGWRSAALVLVDDEAAARVRASYVRPTDSNGSSSSSSSSSSGSSGTSSSGSNPAVPPPPSSALGSVTDWLRGVARGFIGTPTASASGAGRTEDAHFFETDASWVWNDEPFPRLRLEDGEEMPGEVPLTAWNGGEPAYYRR